MAPIPLTWNEALSGVFGSISLAAWIFLLLPQLIENYQQGHADGISITFLCIWFVGDITNLAGALWAGLVPTVVALAVYFCIADLVLIAQCLYYLRIKKRTEEKGERAREHANGAPAESEHTPLLNGDVNKSPQSRPRRRLTDVTDENLGLPGSRRVSNSSLRRQPSHENRTGLPLIDEEPTRTRTAIKNILSILGVMAVGAAGWAIAWKAGAWRPTPVGQEEGGEPTPIGAEILGYISAICYLGARIPQIIKNQREKSCEGLSLLFFLLSLMGNLTYGAGILFHSVERQYILTNLPWLIGSLGTIAEDAIIFIQFHVFGEKEGGAVV
ncbi:vacuolar amino acid transporter [Lecanosticta acicola]|uniref:Vacuolar amino acid transporter n=1 Tax=Lecanosticta acicola TaxID=111012 RepID=A0AAI8Z7Z8_9PEZI|nr:vacuolar amino acid transporter [Lecanosticta acicola]